MSFGFNVKKDAWFTDDGEPSDRFHGTRRELREVELIEVSPVTRPAYGGTAITARDESSALLEARERAADSADEGNEAERLADELRAADINTAGRKALAAKGQALPDGSYPIPDKAHLHSAAILAASGHGDVAAAKALIRKRAKELGVDVTTLPGFGKEDKDDPAEPDVRDDPDGKEYEAIDEALRQIKAGDVKGAEKTLAANQATRNQEPDTSTPDDEDDFALRLAIRANYERSRAVGFI
jgi:hypothetical protein